MSTTRRFRKTGEEPDLRSFCSICRHPEMNMIEALCAAGAFIGDIAFEFDVSERELRRHENLHSTKIPTIDPVAILRHLRWLQEQADNLTRSVLGNSATAIPSEKTRKARIAAIENSLKVARELIDLTSAKKHMDPHVTLPRWSQFLNKLVGALNDEPQALAVLLDFMKEMQAGDHPVAVKVRRILAFGPDGNLSLMRVGENGNTTNRDQDVSKAKGTDGEAIETAPDEKTEEEIK